MSRTSLSEKQLAERAPVWEALSNFWLDTELQDHDFTYIAKAIATSPYSIDEIKDIHRYEVVPAVSGNLASIAGEWAGFNREWLIERCSRNANKSRSALRRARLLIQSPLLWVFTVGHWRKVLPRVHELRNTAAQQGVPADRTRPTGSCGR